MKNLSYIFTLILFLGLVTSCSSYEDNALNKNAQSVAVEDVRSTFTELKQFNDSLLLNIPQARWSWKNMGRAPAVAGADIMGAAAGVAANKELITIVGGATGGSGAVAAAAVAGTICGAGASYVAYCETAYTVSIESLSVKQIMEKIPVGSFQTPTPTTPLPSPSAKCGIIHNVTLKNIISPADDVPAISTSNNYNYVASELAKGNLDENKVSSTYNKIISSLTPAIQDNFNYNKALDDMKTQGIISENLCKAYELFLEVYRNYPQNQDNIDFIINKYLSVIKSSTEFSEDEKDCLYLGLSVAPENPGFWAEQMNESTN